MAAAKFLAHREVSDLCLGKPALRSLSLSATVAEAISALQSSDHHDTFLSLWTCHHEEDGLDSDPSSYSCKCIGKICMVDLICFLCREDSLLSPATALLSPLSLLFPHSRPNFVSHVEPSCSLGEAIDLILKGAQNLVVPIKARQSWMRKKQQQKLSSTFHNGREYCWLTQEDVIRFFLSSIAIFSPLPALSIDSLGMITTDVLTIEYHSPASSALEAISASLADQTSVAVVDSDGILMGEISPFALSSCDETVAAAITTLSAGELMAYIDCGRPPEDLARVVTAGLKRRGLEAMLDEFNNFVISSNSSLSSSSSSSSSEDEDTPRAVSMSSRKQYNRSMSYSARMVRRAEAIVCHPKSSLVAVMVQAIAHRVNYVWVMEEDCSLVGIVTFASILRVFREHF
ncbi:unnamed protein product [Linum trigynum]|uniref:CBS domain-containing protein n=1 Tax=Linum trigynum TaxID=586398 RepID=A0AAV2CAD2_9ROSI